MRPVEPTRQRPSPIPRPLRRVGSFQGVFIPLPPGAGIGIARVDHHPWAVPFTATRATQTFTGAAQTWLVVNIPPRNRGRRRPATQGPAWGPLLEPLPVPRRLISQKTPPVWKAFQLRPAGILLKLSFTAADELTVRGRRSREMQFEPPEPIAASRTGCIPRRNSVPSNGSTFARQGICFTFSHSYAAEANETGAADRSNLEGNSGAVAPSPALLDLGVLLTPFLVAFRRGPSRRTLLRKFTRASAEPQSAI